MSEINSIYSAYSGESSTSDLASALGKDDFMKILVAQMQNQDPTEPMDNTQYISQLAQFSALEQMQQLNAAFGYSKAYALLGKSVSAEITDGDGNTQVVSGTVSGVVTINKTPYLNVNGNFVSPEAPLVVHGVGSDELLQSASMIGKYITGTYTDGDGVAQTVTGQVDRIAIVDNLPMLYVGEQGVYLTSITQVSANPIGVEE